MSLFNVNWDRYSPDQLSHKKTYKPIIKQRDSVQKAIIAGRLMQDISIEERAALIAITNNIKDSKTKLRAYTKKKRVLDKKQAYKGRSNFKFWLDQFGTETKTLFISLLLLFLTIKYDLPKYAILVSTLALSVTLFQLYYLFFKTALDFYNPVYIIAQIITAMISAVIVFLFMKMLVKKEKLKTIIRSLFSFIYEVDELVKEDSKTEFKKRRVKITNNAIE